MNTKKTIFAALMGLLFAMGFSMTAVATNDFNDFPGTVPMEDNMDYNRMQGCQDTDKDNSDPDVPTSGCDTIAYKTTAEMLWQAVEDDEEELSDLQKELSAANAAIKALEDMDDTNDAAHICTAVMGSCTAIDAVAEMDGGKAAALARHKMRVAALEDSAMLKSVKASITALEDKDDTNDAAHITADDMGANAAARKAAALMRLKAERSDLEADAMNKGEITVQMEALATARTAKDARNPNFFFKDTPVDSVTEDMPHLDSVTARVYAYKDADKEHKELMAELTATEASIAALEDDDDANDAAHIKASDMGDSAADKKTAALKRLRDRKAALEDTPDDSMTMNVDESADGLITKAMKARDEAETAVQTAQVSWRSIVERDVIDQKIDHVAKDATLKMREKELADKKATLALLEDSDPQTNPEATRPTEHADDAAWITALKEEIGTLEEKEATPGAGHPAGSVALAKKEEEDSLKELLRRVERRNALVDPNNPAGELLQALLDGDAQADDLVDAVSGNFALTKVNKANIATNTADIATNKTAIATNTAAIATNRTNIATNTRLINQLQNDVDTIRSGVAAALAVAGMPNPPNDGWGFAVGAGHFDGESAFAAGLTFKDEDSTYKISVGTSGGEATVSAGGAWSF